MLNWSIFTKATPADRTNPTRLYDPADFDFSLVARAAAIDKGQVIPGITDGFTGAAPDLGALERGKPAPHYGPRPLAEQP